jgi:hypothetical protein
MSHIIDSAQTFIVSNARLLERHLFDFHFRQGNPEHVRKALLAYQNADGGFGNALEPDKRTSSSQPIDQEFALHVLDDIGFDSRIALQICDFLETFTTAEGGVPFVLPSVRDAPRAPWWNTDLEKPPASINPTASIAGLLHKHNIQYPWLSRATDYCWQFIEEQEITGGHDFLSIQLFLENVADRERAERAFDRISAQLIKAGHITYDPAASGYVFMPLKYAPSPQNMSHRLFDAKTIESHLTALASEQQPDGGWLTTWTAVSPACELEFRGIVTLNALKTLKAYDHLG